jgi:molybdopterin-guanine dinucleotide biosynthesis protein A
MAEYCVDQITAVILAGGRGQRMGGADKGLQLLHGKPLIAHVLDRLQPQVRHVLINANRNLERYAQFGHPVIPDLIADYAGPLAGLHAALSEAKSDLVLAVPCDSPFLPLDLASRLLAALNAGSVPLAVACVGSRSQPAFCLTHRVALSNLADYLSAGGHKVAAWQESLNAHQVDFQDRAEAFQNINSPDDLAALA